MSGATVGHGGVAGELSGRVALVTGGSRGLGRAICQGLAAAGAHVVVASRKLEACQEVAEQLNRDTPGGGTAIAAHVAHWAECDRLVEQTLARTGRLDVLVNNAGMSPTYSGLDSITEQLYDKTLAVNLKGPFRLAVLAATHMAGHEGGSVINISTAGSQMASPAQLPYACAKAGLNAMTVGLADAFAPLVRVNCVMPGPFRTDSSRGWAPPEGEDVPFVPMRRMGRPEEIAPIVVHLAGPGASFTTGATVRVDGGVSRRV